MFCSSCGEETGTNFCPSCGTPTSPPSPPAGGGGIGPAGIAVLALTMVALMASFGNMPDLPRLPSWKLGLPAWMSITRPSSESVEAQERGRTTDVQLPPDDAPAVAPAEPYEEVASTALGLSEYTLQEVRLRLGDERTAQDVDALLRSKTKSLRAAGRVVVVKLYARGSDATSADVPLVTYLSTDLGASVYGDPASTRMEEIEPQLYRTPLPR